MASILPFFSLFLVLLGCACSWVWVLEYRPRLFLPFRSQYCVVSVSYFFIGGSGSAKSLGKDFLPGFIYSMALGLGISDNFYRPDYYDFVTPSSVTAFLPVHRITFVS